MAAVFTLADARREPTMYIFRMGIGFLRLISPLAMPPTKLGEASECEPPQGVADESKHVLVTPQGPEFVCEWKSRAWIPPVEAQGRSYGFTPAYLAALGWKYKGPAL